uniref:type IVB secretion system protein IcmH/DotU n=1 Tax=Serratia quinivorans TaxID=137545 RepID=UPI0035C666F8
MKRFWTRTGRAKIRSPVSPHQLAEGIFVEAVRLSELRSMANLPALRQRLGAQLTDFQRQAADAGLSPQQVYMANYALCTLLDEAIGDTGWGSGVWGSNSLLMHFYGESHGGERFFSLLAQAEEANNESLLALFYLCLALGLEGRYRVLPDGEAQLMTIRQRLYRRLNTQCRVPAPQGWRRFFSRLGGRRSWLCGVALLGLASACLLQLNLLSAVDHQHQRLQTLAAAPRQPSLVQLLATALAEDIRNGALELAAEGRGARIILNSGAFFASGGTEISPLQRNVLQRLAANLQPLPVAVRIVGHSDNVSVSRKWQSNRALSLARARTVMHALAPPDAESSFSLVAEGRGADEPLVANDNADNRARNRRVEIYITPLD